MRDAGGNAVAGQRGRTGNGQARVRVLAPAGNERVADLILEALADVLPSQLSNP